MELTVSNLLRAVELAISIDWLADRILDDTDQYDDVRQRAFLKVASDIDRAVEVFRGSERTDPINAAVLKDALAPYLATINLTLARTLVREAEYQEIEYGDEA